MEIEVLHELVSKLREVAGSLFISLHFGQCVQSWLIKLLL